MRSRIKPGMTVGMAIRSRIEPGVTVIVPGMTMKKNGFPPEFIPVPACAGINSGGDGNDKGWE
jgi:hypothetical protein